MHPRVKPPSWQQIRSKRCPACAGQAIGAVSRVGGVLMGYGEAQVVIAQEAREKAIGRVDVRDAGQAQLLDQAIL